MLWYVLRFVNKNSFLDYRLEYVCNAIDCYANGFELQGLWTFQIEF